MTARVANDIRDHNAQCAMTHTRDIAVIHNLVEYRTWHMRGTLHALVMTIIVVITVITIVMYVQGCDDNARWWCVGTSA